MIATVIISLISIVLFLIMGVKYLGLSYKYDNLKDKYDNQVLATKKYRKWWMEKCGHIEKD
jgi:hypothetical protein